jgi:Autotransporter beta-domain.
MRRAIGMSTARWAMAIAGAISAGSIAFPGVARTASGSPGANEFLSNLETGYHFHLDDRTALTPFAAMQGIVIAQGAFTEKRRRRHRSAGR